MRSRQAGQGKVGCFLWLLAASIAALIAFKMIPVKVKSAELHDFMVEQARFASNYPSEQIAKSILDRARELELPLTEKQLRVEKVRERIKMEAIYTVPVEFPGYTYYWEFHHMVDRPIFVV
jgi:hypothetical protein